MEKQTRQFGLWPSSISPKTMAAGSKRLAEVQWDEGGLSLVWLEGRSDRSVLVAADAGGVDAPRDLTADLSVRGKVGYGGGDFTVAKGVVYFADAESGRLCRQSLAGGGSTPVTPPFGAAAAPSVSPDGRFLAYVHHDEADIDRIAVVDAAGRLWPQILASGHDFYSSLRWSPDGKAFAFVAWDHPEMPWDGTWLYVSTVQPGAADGLPSLSQPRCVAGGKDVSISQPEFSPDSRTLVYVSDESGFWQLHSHDLATGQSRQITRTEGAEYGQPNWAQEMRSYALTADGRQAIAAINRNAFTSIHSVDLASGDIKPLAALSAYTDAGQLTVKGHRLAFIGSSPTVSQRVVVYELDTAAARVAARQTGETYIEGELSQPVALTWPSGGEESHGLYYAPLSTGFTGTGRPPLVVVVHGGPTSQERARFRLEAQFFATRGYAVLYVNHRGSTGYGREYMRKQRGKWGQVDVEDAVSGARYLIQQGNVDPERTVIMGGSAGGYTVLQTMVDVPEAFTAGIVLYGIANQFTLVADTHKFEARYSDSLLGPLPEAAALYRERSPLFHAAKIKRPLAIFQGTADKVVPKEQSDSIVKALQRGGVPHVYHLYEGEGHGFRKHTTIEHYYDAVEKFLHEYVIYR